MKCKCGGEIIKRSGKFGEFWGCSNFPECKINYPLYFDPESHYHQKLITHANKKCPFCKEGKLKFRKSIYGVFVGCAECGFNIGFEDAFLSNEKETLKNAIERRKEVQQIANMLKAYVSQGGNIEKPENDNFWGYYAMASGMPLELLEED